MMFIASFLNTISTSSCPSLQFHDELVSILESMTRSYLSKERKESVTVGTICSRPIYPCAICAWVLNALVHVRAFNWGSIVGVAAEANLRDHAVRITDLVVFRKAVV